MKTGSASSAMAEMQMKAMLRFHLTPGGMAAIKKTDGSNTGEDRRKEMPVFPIVRNANNAVTMEISVEVSQKQPVLALI